MLQSQLFTRTKLKPPKEAESISHKYLIQGDFIDCLASGIFSFLPLGFRVYKKIENIIRDQMNSLGGQEVYLPTLQPKTLWLVLLLRCQEIFLLLHSSISWLTLYCLLLH